MTVACAGFLMAIYQFHPTASWACTAGGSSGFSYSSQTNANSVTVCAKSAVAVRTVSSAKPVAAPKETAKPAPKAPTKPVIKPAPAPPAKPVVKAPSTVALLTPIKKGVPISLQKPKPAPKPSIRPAPIAAPKTIAQAPKNTTATLVSSAEASFSPAALMVTASDSEVTPGDPVGFSTNAVLHYKNGSLLGKNTDVQFLPIQTSWNFGDGSGASGNSATHGFNRIGTYIVSATVLYSVSYQIVGASAWISSGSISVTDSLSLPVVGAGESEAPPLEESVAVVRLVGKNCIDNPGSFGCST